MLERTIWDVKEGAVEIVLASGKSEVFHSPQLKPPGDTSIRQVVIDYRRWAMSLDLPLGPVEVELGWPGSRDQTTGSRPIVYLDQNHWSMLRSVTWDSTDRLDPREVAAAKRVIELARARAIVLPLSSAHAVETDPLYGERRLHHASTLLGLSGGWQMRNPIQIRGREMQQALVGGEPDAAGVFTLEPNVLFAGQGERQPKAEMLDEMVQRLSWVTALYEGILDPEQPDMTEARRKAERWARVHGRVASRMSGVTSQKKRRQMVREFLIQDLQIEASLAGRACEVSPVRVRKWQAECLHDGFSSLPYLGRWEEVLFHRLSNSGDRWTGNDLFDLNFLGAAAAYADVVIAERKMGDYLRRGVGIGSSGALVCAKLSEAVRHVESLIDPLASVQAAA